MQVRLTRDEVEEACEMYVMDRLRSALPDSWWPEVVDVTFHQTGMGATVEVEYVQKGREDDDDA